MKICKNFWNYSISRDDFFKQLGRSKFVLCPVGNANDTFRFYDTIYSGAIPIVVKQYYHDLPIFEGVPILYLNNYEEFKNLTEDFLNKKYDELIPYKKKYYPNFDFSNFISNIKKLL